MPTYCIQCGLEGRPVIAIGEDSDGEPACSGHAKKETVTARKPATVRIVHSEPDGITPDDKLDDAAQLAEADLSDSDVYRSLYDAVAPESLIRVGPTRPGRNLCLRCGYRWSARAGSPDPPKTCAWCNSAYWNEPAKTPRGRRPENTDWKAEASAKADRYKVRARDHAIRRAQEVLAQMKAEGLLPTTTESGVRTSASVQGPGPVSRSVLPPPPDMREGR